jgi:hypothetical protein
VRAGRCSIVAADGVRAVILYTYKGCVGLGCGLFLYIYTVIPLSRPSWGILDPVVRWNTNLSLYCPSISLHLYCKISLHHKILSSLLFYQYDDHVIDSSTISIPSSSSSHVCNLACTPRGEMMRANKHKNNGPNSALDPSIHPSMMRSFLVCRQPSFPCRQRRPGSQCLFILLRFLHSSALDERTGW